MKLITLFVIDIFKNGFQRIKQKRMDYVWKKKRSLSEKRFNLFIAFFILKCQLWAWLSRVYLVGKANSRKEQRLREGGIVASLYSDLWGWLKGLRVLSWAEMVLQNTGRSQSLACKMLYLILNLENTNWSQSFKRQVFHFFSEWKPTIYMYNNTWKL